ncbi:MAG: methyl-accepting chemotaxis protein [Peptococcia bacterium]
MKLVGYDLLEAFVTAVPHIKNVYPRDISMAVADKQSYLIYEKGEEIDLGIKTGDPIKEGSAMDQALKKREKVVTVLDKEIWGNPYKSIAVPIFDEADNVIGGVAAVVNVDNELRLQEIIEQFTTAFEQVNNSVQDISSGAQNLAKVGEKLSAATYATKDNVKKTDEIIQMIREIADQTKMLGINAAIEAARAGEYGRGFAVVAEEIRRLSEQSNASAKEVKDILNKIASSIDSINEQTQETSAVSEEQSSSTQEIAASMEELTAQLESLADFVRTM